MEDRLALSALDWWGEAGLDIFVEEAPRDWLARAKPVVAPDAAPAELPTPGTDVLPHDLAAFRAFLLASPSVPGGVAGRLDATGDAAGGTMVIVDMPEQADRREGRLLGGEVGQLFDRMLAAIGLARDAVYLAPLSLARPMTGAIAEAAEAPLAMLMRHHLSLVRPRRLLLLGDATARAMLGLPCLEARGRLHTVDFKGGAVPAVASFHPRIVHAHRDHRQDVWADLQLFMGLSIDA